MSSQHRLPESIKRISVEEEDEIAEVNAHLNPSTVDQNVKQNKKANYSCMNASAKNLVRFPKQGPLSPSIRDPKWLERCRKIDLEERKVVLKGKQDPDLIEQLCKLALKDWKCDDETRKLSSSEEMPSSSKPVDKFSLDTATTLSSNINYWSCIHCSNVFEDHAMYSQHMQNCQVSKEQNVKKAKSALCPKILKPEELILNMAEAGTTSNSCACYICHKQFVKKNSLIVHYFYHVQEGSYVPKNILPKPLSMIWRRNMHLQTKKFKSKVCTVCKRPFKNLTCKHYFKELATDSYVCAFCNKKYPLKLCIQRHVMRHLKIKEHATKIYNHIFKHQCDRAIKVRELLSEDEKRPFVCKVCLEGFFEEHLFIQHNEAHLKFEQDIEQVSILAGKLDLSNQNDTG